ncbi:SOS response-associated peptidase [Aeromicrobium sp. Marseille-Q0843]|uniref:Abasic site processing protein n=1 Tax=Aeromicrobium phoceense TaxID=2754045 RepID=A0A838XE08_9ACTN|nr:SOS response-associated peptidase [Aeromicrobium phoceense]MBA4609699.1 SOS response-associated peptidase [Aeromicrobium phoceense]
MCGRYATSRTPTTLVDDFESDLGDLFVDTGPDFNLAPTKLAPLVVARSGDAGPRRELVTAKWGLVPSWAKDPSIGNRLINARSETVAEKPSFRSAFAKRRAIVPADGFYEWYQPEAEPGAKRPPKQPFFMSAEGGLGLAGLYEFWKDPEGEWLLTYTILTTSAEGEDGRIHDRAPLIVGAEVAEHWLAAEPWPEALEHLVPATPGVLDTWPVSTEVNNVRNNGPELVEPLPLEGE